MRYVGSKNKLAKHILPIILNDIKPTQHYVEPFVGAFNMMDKVRHPLRIGNDIDEYIISLYTDVIYNNWIPPDYIDKNTYNQIKNNKDAYDKSLVAFLGYGGSFGGK